MTYEVVPASDADELDGEIIPGKFYVYDSNGNRIAGPFNSEEAALKWIRENEVPRPKG